MAGRKGQRSGGHNAKTTEQHKIDGTYNTTRHRKRADNTPAKSKPKLPRGLSKVEKAIWKEFSTLLPDGVLGRIDTTALRELCRWYEIYATTVELFKSDPTDKEARLSACAAWDRFWRIAQDFGATPVARTRLEMDTGTKKKDASPMQQLHDLMASRN